MMLRRKLPQDPRELAIDWLAREREGRLAPDQQAALTAWLEADPQHAEVYARAKAAVETPARYAAHPELMDMRASALAAMKERPNYPRMIAAAAAVVMAVTTLGAGWVSLSPSTSPSVSRLQEAAAPILPALNPNAAIYRTAVGERTSVTLPDGSIAILNTDTLLKVAYTGHERGVRLVRGQALFEVAHNKRVPFQVYAGDRRVTAVGTMFDVRLDAKKVKVTLVEGVVRVAALTAKPSALPQQVTMTAGEELQAGPLATMTIKTADVAAETSWKSGVVVFKAETLAQAAAEVNRYTDRPVRLADASLADYRITGVFKTGDPDNFAQAVTEILPVRVEPQADGSLVLSEK